MFTPKFIYPTIPENPINAIEINEAAIKVTGSPLKASGISLSSILERSPEKSTIASMKPRPTPKEFTIDSINPGIAGAQMGHIAQFAEMDLDGYEFILKIDLIDAGGEDQPGQLLGQGLRSAGAEVGEINLGCHERIPPEFMLYTISLS